MGDLMKGMISDTYNPLVSVIIACYNAENYIEECIKSLLNQTYKNIEIIICDDNSTDKSFNLLKEYAKIDNRILLLKNNENLFAAATRNKCIERSKGEFIVIQDIDDKSKLDRIEKLVKHFQSDNVDFVSSGMIGFNEHGEERLLYKEKKLPNKNDFLWGLPFYHAPTMFTRDSIKKVNGYRVSNETKRGQDYDLFMRLYIEGFKGKNIPDLLYYYRVDGETIKRRRFSARLGECIIRYKGFKKLGLFPKGLPYVIKPIIAHFVQFFNYRNYYLRK